MKPLMSCPCSRKPSLRPKVNWPRRSNWTAGTVNLYSQGGGWRLLAVMQPVADIDRLAAVCVLLQHLDQYVDDIVDVRLVSHQRGQREGARHWLPVHRVHFMVSLAHQAGLDSGVGEGAVRLAL